MSLHERLSERWRYALLGGLLAVPFTTASYWQTGSELSLGAVFWAGMAVGYLAKRRGLPSTPVGVRAGVVGALPGLWMAGDIVAFVLTLSGPGWFRAAQLLVVVVVTVLTFVLAAAVGGLGARLGGWLAERSGHPRSVHSV